MSGAAHFEPIHAARLDEIATWLETGAGEVPNTDIVGFDMTYWIYRMENACGTVCCIGGYVQERFASYVGPGEGLGYAGAGALLGLDPIQSCHLFDPYPKLDLGDVTPRWAARTIRHLIATGTVDWNATRHAL